MDVVETGISGVLLIKPKIWRDTRGYFVETWQQERYAEVGINLPFVQDNHSRSTHGVLRGLHYQKTRPQGKLISVSMGTIFDVAVDIRNNSSTFGKWFGVELTHKNQWQLWIAPGLAHGFVVLSDFANLHYKCTDYYCKEDEGSYRWNDPVFNIDWPIKNPIISDKDANANFFNINFINKSV